MVSRRQGAEGDTLYWECHCLRAHSSFSVLENKRMKQGTQKLKGNAKIMLTFMFIQNHSIMKPLVFEPPLFFQQWCTPFGL